MTVLTPSDINHIRQQSGDTCEDYEVSDSYIQYLHDRYGATTCDCDALGVTIWWVLKTRVKKAIPLVNQEGEGGARSLSQKYDHLKEQLKDWEQECGLGSYAITIGTLSMGFDTQSIDEFSNEDLYPPYGGHYS
jgi:hypothetical protein